ncbi:hypothetical protein MMC14_008685 [Varicellaria rhodocarpa]|nr:hypothetical protein [Varicellaria rhodocarpa]
MKAFLVSSLFISLACAIAVPGKVSYDGYKVVRLHSSAQIKSMIQGLALKTWNGAAKDDGEVDVVIPPSVHAFDGMDMEVMHENLGASIAEEAKYDAYAAGSVNSTWFNSYHTYADHLQFLKDLQTAYPANSEIVVAGNSLQGKPITGIHIYGSAGKGTKPAVVFHGTVHAREWITTMVTEYFAFNLLSNFASNTEIMGFVNKYDFYIFPIVNPDGFSYTQTNDRLWRKNRQTTSGSSCLGHDINRNWPYMWSVAGGASTDPCAEDFKGNEYSPKQQEVLPANQNHLLGLQQGDAPETGVLSSYLNTLAKASTGLKLYIDYHSYSQLFMTPYGYSCTVVATNNANLQSLAGGVVAAIKAVYGTVFQYGPICTTIYQATGSSVDYVNDVTKAQYAFTSELRDTGKNGFVLPANQILPSAVEAYAGVRYLLLNMK